MQISPARFRAIDTANQITRLCQLFRAVGAHQHSIAARVGHHHNLALTVATTAITQQLVCQRRHIERHTVADRQDIRTHGVGRINTFDNLGNARQIIGIVRNHQRIVRWIGIDGIVGRDHGAQNRNKVRRTLITKLEHAG